jgi:hypothetical protein
MASPVSTPARSRHGWDVLALGAGNAMEWHDWGVYATFSAFSRPSS